MRYFSSISYTLFQCVLLFFLSFSSQHSQQTGKTYLDLNVPVLNNAAKNFVLAATQSTGSVVYENGSLPQPRPSSDNGSLPDFGDFASSFAEAAGTFGRLFGSDASAAASDDEYSGDTANYRSNTSDDKNDAVDPNVEIMKLGLGKVAEAAGQWFAGKVNPNKTDNEESLNAMKDGFNKMTKGAGQWLIEKSSEMQDEENNGTANAEEATDDDEFESTWSSMKNQFGKMTKVFGAWLAENGDSGNWTAVNGTNEGTNSQKDKSAERENESGTMPDGKDISTASTLTGGMQDTHSTTSKTSISTPSTEEVTNSRVDKGTLPAKMSLKNAKHSEDKVDDDPSAGTAKSSRNRATPDPTTKPSDVRDTTVSTSTIAESNNETDDAIDTSNAGTFTMTGDKKVKQTNARDAPVNKQSMSFTQNIANQTGATNYFNHGSQIGDDDQKEVPSSFASFLLPQLAEEDNPNAPQNFTSSIGKKEVHPDDDIVGKGLNLLYQDDEVKENKSTEKTSKNFKNSTPSHLKKSKLIKNEEKDGNSEEHESDDENDESSFTENKEKDSDSEDYENGDEDAQTNVIKDEEQDNDSGEYENDDENHQTYLTEDDEKNYSEGFVNDEENGRSNPTKNEEKDDDNEVYENDEENDQENLTKDGEKNYSEGFLNDEKNGRSNPTKKKEKDDDNEEYESDDQNDQNIRAPSSEKASKIAKESKNTNESRKKQSNIKKSNEKEDNEKQRYDEDDEKQRYDEDDEKQRYDEDDEKQEKSGRASISNSTSRSSKISSAKLAKEKGDGNDFLYDDEEDHDYYDDRNTKDNQEPLPSRNFASPKKRFLQEEDDLPNDEENMTDDVAGSSVDDGPLLQDDADQEEEDVKKPDIPDEDSSNEQAIQDEDNISEVTTSRGNQKDEDLDEQQARVQPDNQNGSETVQENEDADDPQESQKAGTEQSTANQQNQKRQENGFPSEQPNKNQADLQNDNESSFQQNAFPDVVQQKQRNGGSSTPSGAPQDNQRNGQNTFNNNGQGYQTNGQYIYNNNNNNQLQQGSQTGANSNFYQQQSDQGFPTSNFQPQQQQPSLPDFYVAQPQQPNAQNDRTNFNQQLPQNGLGNTVQQQFQQNDFINNTPLPQRNDQDGSGMRNTNPQQQQYGQDGAQNNSRNGTSNNSQSFQQKNRNDTANGSQQENQQDNLIKGDSINDNQSLPQNLQNNTDRNSTDGLQQNETSDSSIEEYQPNGQQTMSNNTQQLQQNRRNGTTNNEETYQQYDQNNTNNSDQFYQQNDGNETADNDQSYQPNDQNDIKNNQLTDQNETVNESQFNQQNGKNQTTNSSQQVPNFQQQHMTNDAEKFQQNALTDANNDNNNDNNTQYGHLSQYESINNTQEFQPNGQNEQINNTQQQQQQQFQQQGGGDYPDAQSNITSGGAWQNDSSTYNEAFGKNNAINNQFITNGQKLPQQNQSQIYQDVSGQQNMMGGNSTPPSPPTSPSIDGNGDVPSRSIAYYYGVVVDDGVQPNPSAAGKVLPLSEVLFAPLVLTPSNVMNGLSALGGTPAADNFSYSYSDNVVPACSSSLDSAGQVFGLNPGGLRINSGGGVGGINLNLLSPGALNFDLFGGSGGGGEREVSNGNDSSNNNGDNGMLLNAANPLGSLNLDNLLGKAQNLLSSLGISRNLYGEEEENNTYKDSKQYTHDNIHILEAALEEKMQKDINNNNINEHTEGFLSRKEDGDAGERKLLAGLLNYGMCSMSSILTEKSANMVRETCNCVSKNVEMNITSVCATYNSIFAAWGCTATPPDCSKVDLQTTRLQLEDPSSLDLPMDNLLSRFSSVPPAVPNEVLLREGFTYYLIWKAMQTLYKLCDASFCARKVHIRQPQLNYILPGWNTEAYIYTAPIADTNDTQLTTVVSRRNDQILITTRGTKTRFEWKMNFEASQVSSSTLGFPDESVATAEWPGKVHHGFALIFEAIFPSIVHHLETLRVYPQTNNNTNNDDGYINNTGSFFPIKRIIVSGHSLGAAVSVLIAYQLSVLYPGMVDFVGFGSPKAGDNTFVEEFSRMVNSRMLQFSLDPVTEMPCEKVMACDADEAFVPTKLSPEDSVFNYTNYRGIVQIMPAMLPAPNWSLLGANLQAYAAHTCAYNCFLTSRFAQLDPQTECRPPKKNDTLPYSGDVCEQWFISPI